MGKERVADLLEEMSPDDAADGLGEIDDDKAHEPFALIKDHEKADVAEPCISTTTPPPA